MDDLPVWKRLSAYLKGNSRQPERCFWSVDIHSHLIPAIDDGVKDDGQALICLTQLAEWGIRKIIATPHINGDWYPLSINTVLNGQRRLQTLIDQHQLPLNLSVAAEYLIDDHFFDLLQKKELLTFGSKQYLLLETGWTAPPNQLNDILFRIQTQGYTPVLAHPERYRYYHKNKEALLQLHEMGCLFQLNWMSLTGRYGAGSQQQARYLLQKQLISFVGSDLHGPGDLADMVRIFNANDLRLLGNQTLLNESLADPETPVETPTVLYKD